ncbi:hypothetical protein NDU88_002653 [Pleurodeles waltl]|uniref:Uncharacterized protein n=1 Tax=Pleurodeles waltl TaxID=8319 RepID=A0AAV7MBM3_PLEWA|nr:hypothetical protein NDU88_002653 [Pleurodeles waltl]
MVPVVRKLQRGQVRVRSLRQARLRLTTFPQKHLAKVYNASKMEEWVQEGRRVGTDLKKSVNNIRLQIVPGVLVKKKSSSVVAIIIIM